MKVLMKVN